MKIREYSELTQDAAMNYVETLTGRESYHFEGVSLFVGTSPDGRSVVILSPAIGASILLYPIVNRDASS